MHFTHSKAQGEHYHELLTYIYNIIFLPVYAYELEGSYTYFLRVGGILHLYTYKHKFSPSIKK